MGTIHVINSIKIYLYPGDHNPPHIHAVYAEHDVAIAIQSRETIKGYMPTKQLNMVKSWLNNKDVRDKLEEMFHILNPQVRRG